MSLVQKTFTLPVSHLQALEAEAARMGLTLDQALAQAIRLYQASNQGGYPAWPARAPGLLDSFEPVEQPAPEQLP